MGTEPVCEFCGVPVDERRAFRSVEGFEAPRKGGGANQIVLRKPTGRFACASCIYKQRHGIAQEQGSLL